MKITLFDLLNQPEVSHKLAEVYNADFPSAQVDIITVNADNLKDCIGCWSCWVKTPGKCVHSDDMTPLYTNLMTSDRVLLMLPTQQGFVSGPAKTFIDRLIPIYHPYITLIEGEMMHVDRYDKYPQFEFYYDPKGLQEEDQLILEDYFYRMAHHFRQKGFVVKGTNNGQTFTRQLLEDRGPAGDLPMDRQEVTKGHYIVYNGSPRGKKGNSHKIALQVIEGLKEAGVPEDQIELRHLVQQKAFEGWAQTFHDHSHHFFVLPLYVHSMPGIVKKYLDLIEPTETGKTQALIDEKATPPQMTFFVQSGFSGAFQSYYLRAYFARLPKRLKCLYGGTLIRGGMEGLQIQPDEANKKLYANLRQLGYDYVKEGKLPDRSIQKLASAPYMPKWAQVVFKMLIPTGLTNFYWNMQLKKNGVYDQRFDQPYVTGKE